MTRENHYSRLWLLLVAGLTASGCVTSGNSLKSTLSTTERGSLAADLGPFSTADHPRLARMQIAEPSSTALPAAPALFVAPALKKGYRITVRAWVNGKPIFDDEVFQTIAPVLPELQREPEPGRSEKLSKLYNQALDQLIDYEVAYQDATHKLEKANPKALAKLKDVAGQEFDKQIAKAIEANKIPEAEFFQTLKAQGVSLDIMRKQKEREFIAMEYLRSRIFPLLQSRIGHAEIREYYEQHLNEFRQEDTVKWQDVFIAVGPKLPTVAQARRFAEDLLAQVRTSEDFARLQQYDEGDSKYRNGEGFGSRRGQIKPPELEEHLFNMREGEIGPVVEFSTGVHVFRLIKREFATQLALDDKIQQQIRSKLRNDIANREFKRIIRELRSRAIVEIEQGN